MACLSGVFVGVFTECAMAIVCPISWHNTSVKIGQIILKEEAPCSNTTKPQVDLEPISGNIATRAPTSPAQQGRNWYLPANPKRAG